MEPRAPGQQVLHDSPVFLTPAIPAFNPGNVFVFRPLSSTSLLSLPWSSLSLCPAGTAAGSFCPPVLPRDSPDTSSCSVSGRATLSKTTTPVRACPLYSCTGVLWSLISNASSPRTVGSSVPWPGGPPPILGAREHSISLPPAQNDCWHSLLTGHWILLCLIIGGPKRPSAAI